MISAASEEPFRTLFEPHRRSITLHCYRMLGSLEDAEELVQESLLRAWQRQDEARSSSGVRAWLYSIATNACLDYLRKARRRRALPHLLASPPSAALKSAAGEQLWIEPAPDTLLDVEDDAATRPDERVSARESIGLAFISALQLLPPKQRAALLLVDVLGWKPDAAASLLETTLVSVNSLLQRARKSVPARRANVSEPDVSGSEAALLRRFISAWESGDVDAFAALLTDDALFSMPPQPEWFAGRHAIRHFFAGIWATLPGQRRLLPLRANGGPAVAVYRRPTTANALYEPNGIVLIASRGERISEMTRFGSPRLFPLFGLPSQLAGE